MILDFNSQSAIVWVQGRPLCNRPGLEDAIHLQPQIVVKPGGGVLLDHEASEWARLDPRLPARLRGLREVALGLVEGELACCHRHTTGWPRCMFRDDGARRP